MTKAIWNGTVLAESDETMVVEGNHYFPPESVRSEHLSASEHHTWCGWKGEANYYDIVVDGETNSGAAWYYPDPYPAARAIRNKIAFWRGVKIIQ